MKGPARPHVSEKQASGLLPSSLDGFGSSVPRMGSVTMAKSCRGYSPRAHPIGGTGHDDLLVFTVASPPRSEMGGLIGNRSGVGNWAYKSWMCSRILGIATAFRQAAAHLQIQGISRMSDPRLKARELNSNSPRTPHEIQSSQRDFYTLRPVTAEIQTSL